MGQLVHALDDEEAEYDPAAQEEHTVDDSIEYFPDAQAPVTAVRPVVAQNEPAGHVVHAVDPVET